MFGNLYLVIVFDDRLQPIFIIGWKEQKSKIIMCTHSTHLKEIFIIIVVVCSTTFEVILLTYSSKFISINPHSHRLLKDDEENENLFCVFFFLVDGFYEVDEW